jgi:hypothetical protein
MPQKVPLWWTDERVHETVDSQYIHSHLHPDEQCLLKQSPSFGTGLTDDTYLDWILARARRFFLILVDAGIPDQIFGVVDDSYDDDDLPIAEEVVQDLCLSKENSPKLNKRFYKTQFRYVIRTLGDGEHIRYALEETVPVYSLSLKSSVLSLSKHGTDKVSLPTDLGRVFLRKRVVLDQHVTERGVLAEIVSTKTYANQHLISVYGSYLWEESVYILFTPAAEYNLKSFLSDVPKGFENLPKTERRRILIDWPHCLANGLAWIHTNGRHHGLIRPSNILVDDKFNIFFGSFDGSGVLDVTKVDDMEAYQYAAPERWKRAITMQTTGPAKMSGHSGGRTARRVKVQMENSDGSESKRSSWKSGDRLETAAPTATAYAFVPTSKSHFSRLQLGKSDRHPAVSLASTDSLGDRRSDPGSSGIAQPFRSPAQRAETPSSLSHTSSRSNRMAKASITNPIFAAAPEVRTAVVQTWQSAQYDLFAADMFSLGAVLLGILTLLCKRTAGSFERFRSSKNRTAGRGGGLADASFHANIGQVRVWADMLQEDAKKKAKKEDGSVFAAVKPVLQLVSQCLSWDPDERLTAADLEKRLEESISLFANIPQLHCRREVSCQQESPNLKRSISDSSKVLTSRPGNEMTQVPLSVDEWSKLQSKGLTTTIIPSSGLESSLPSLSSFNFDSDINSETVVQDNRSNVTTNLSDGVVSPSVTEDAREIARRLKAKVEEADPDSNWYENDSSVDPSRSTSTSSSQGGFSCDNLTYNKSLSTFGGNSSQRSFFLANSRPSPAPSGPLPPAPQKKPRRTNSYDIRPENFPGVPRQTGSRDSIQRAPLRPELNQNLKSRRLQPVEERQSNLFTEDKEQTNTLTNSILPHRPKEAQEKVKQLDL